MTTFLLPTIKDFYNYKYEISLDNVSYVIHLQYNSRKDGWFLSLYDINNTLLVAGIKLVMGIDLYEQFSHIPGMPSGVLRVLNSNDFIEPNLLNFGKETFLAYIGDA